MRSGRLHPRLLAFEAEQRFDELRDLDLTEMRARSRLEDETTVFAPVGAPRMTEPERLKLQESIRKLSDKHGFPEPMGREAATVFDRELAAVLVREAQLFPAEASSRDVWSFMALVLLPDIAFWRFRGSDGAINRERIVGTDLTRHVFARLWWRAYILCVQPLGSIDLDGLKLLDAFGEADIDQIQSRRRAYGFSPAVFQAIAQLWAGGASTRFDEQAISSREGLRDLLKRLLRLGAFVRFDLLEPDQLKDELERALGETIEGLSDDVVTARSSTAESERSGGLTDQAEIPDDFDDLAFAQMPLLVTNLVDASEAVRGRDLSAEFERSYGVAVPANREKPLVRFAWVAAGLGYLAHDKDSDEWRLGPTRPAVDRRWGSWTLNELKRRAAELEADGAVDAEGALCGELFDGQRPTKLARRLANIAMKEAASEGAVP